MNSVDRAKHAVSVRYSKPRTERKNHPATAEPKYSPEEWEYMNAIDAKRRAVGSPFLTVREHFAVFIGLGYSKTV